jgi:hypothetical protein
MTDITEPTPLVVSTNGGGAAEGGRQPSVNAAFPTFSEWLAKAGSGHSRIDEAGVRTSHIA